MVHDVYSLGVVFLEIGLWKPFVRRRSTVERQVIWKGLDDIINGDELKDGKTSHDVRQRFIDTAQKLLPPRLGRKYTNMVVACLSGNIQEGVDAEGDPEARVGLGYIKNVVSELEKLKKFIEC